MDTKFSQLNSTQNNSNKMPMLVVYTYVYKIWRGLLSIIGGMGREKPSIRIIAAVPRFFYILKLPLHNGTVLL